MGRDYILLLRSGCGPGITWDVSEGGFQWAIIAVLRGFADVVEV